MSTSRKRAREDEGGNDHGLAVSSNSTASAALPAKRRRNQIDAASGIQDVIDLTGDEPEQPGPSTPKRKYGQSKNSPKSTKSTKSQEERRLRVFRKHPPQTFLVKLERARTQRLAKKTPFLFCYEAILTTDIGRMFVVDRTRTGTDEVPEERVDIAGTTGNIYTITIGKEPSCTCPDARKGNQCKHIVYVRLSSTIIYFTLSDPKESFLLEPMEPMEPNRNAA